MQWCYPSSRSASNMGSCQFREKISLDFAIQLFLHNRFLTMCQVLVWILFFYTGIWLHKGYEMIWMWCFQKWRIPEVCPTETGLFWILQLVLASGCWPGASPLWLVITLVGSIFIHMGMGQYLLIPFLVGWTSIYQLFWCSPGVQGFDTAIFIFSFILYTTQDTSGYIRILPIFRLVLSCSTAMSVAMPIASRHGTDSLPFASDCDQSHDFSS